MSEEELPESWVECTMGDIADVVGGGTPMASDPANFAARGHPWITPADLSRFRDVYIQRGSRDLSDQGLRTSSAKMVPAGTVLLSSRAPIGYLAIAANPVSTNQGFRSFICRPGILPGFVYYWLMFSRTIIEDMGSGSTFNEISGSRCKEIPFRFAPAAEQKRIVAKVEELLTRVNAARERLARLPAILKRFRQAVLAAACEGRLTEEWRDRRSLNPWRAKTLETSGARIQIGPFGSLLHREDYRSNGVPLVNPTHIRDGEIVPSSEVSVSEKKANELGIYRLRRGDVVLGRRGEMGRAAVVRNSADGFLCGTGSLFVRPDPRNWSSEFLAFALRSPEIVRALESAAVGSTMINLNQSIVGSLGVPVVEIQEQHEIVRRVKSLFKIADAIEKRVSVVTARAEKVTQAILAKAFRGELVPTEAELARREGRQFESGAKLIQRIHGESMAQTGSRDPRRVAKALSGKMLSGVRRNP